MPTPTTTSIFRFAPLAALAIAGCSTTDEPGDLMPDPEGVSLKDRSFYSTGMEENLSAGRKARGKMFLSENELRPGVKTRPSGLQFEVLVEGDGERPTLQDRVVTTYRARTIDGEVVDNSEDYGGPQEFRVDKVIAGWREALQEMRAGAKWRLFVPPELAYGDKGMAQIPGGETLIYDLELLSIERGGVARESAPPSGAVPEETFEMVGDGPGEPGLPPTGSRDFSLDNLDLLD